MNHTVERQPHTLLSTLMIGISFILGTSILGAYILKSRQIVHQVTVKGLAERTVMANVGIWPISFRITADDLGLLQQKLEKQRTVITNFLHKQGFTQKEISYGIPTIEDKEAIPYHVERKIRYVVLTTITICSSNVSAVEKTLQKSDELVTQGILLDDRWENRPKFLFTNLNEIKPAMIQEATLEARKAAEQFAQDSGSQVGKIHQATQGLFSIEDTHIPTQKHVRVVTTVQYVLVGK